MADLKGKKVAVLVETEYIPFELDYYRDFFEKKQLSAKTAVRHSAR